MLERRYTFSEAVAAIYQYALNPIDSEATEFPSKKIRFGHVAKLLNAHYTNNGVAANSELPEPVLELLLKQASEISLPILSIIPEDVLKNRFIKRKIPNHYLLDNPKNIDNLKIDYSIKTIGTCKLTPEYFANCLMDENSEEYMDLTAYYVKDELVGVAKHRGSTVLLSLVSSENDGIFNLVQGGVYCLPKGHNFKISGLGYREFHIDQESFPITPTRMLYRGRSEMVKYLKKMPAIEKQVLSHRFRWL